MGRSELLQNSEKKKGLGLRSKFAQGSLRHRQNNRTVEKREKSRKTLGEKNTLNRVYRNGEGPWHILSFAILCVRDWKLENKRRKGEKSQKAHRDIHPRKAEISFGGGGGQTAFRLVSILLN